MIAGKVTLHDNHGKLVGEYLDVTLVQALHLHHKKVGALTDLDLTHTDMEHGLLAGLHFQLCNFSYSSLGGMDLRYCNFKTCSFLNVDMHSTWLDGARFDKCKITLADMKNCSTVGTQFRGSLLAHMDMTTCDTHGLCLSGSMLRSIKIEPTFDLLNRPANGLDTAGIDKATLESMLALILKSGLRVLDLGKDLTDSKFCEVLTEIRNRQ